MHYWLFSADETCLSCCWVSCSTSSFLHSLSLSVPAMSSPPRVFNLLPTPRFNLPGEIEERLPAVLWGVTVEQEYKDEQAKEAARPAAAATPKTHKRRRVGDTAENVHEAE